MTRTKYSGCGNKHTERDGGGFRLILLKDLCFAAFS